MRKRTIGILAVCAIISTSSAFAAVKEGSYSLSPLVGGYVFGDNQQFNATPVVGLRAGYSITKPIGVEALYDYVLPPPVPNTGRSTTSPCSVLVPRGFIIFSRIISLCHIWPPRLPG